jgi:putative flippase GtrA
MIEKLKKLIKAADKKIDFKKFTKFGLTGFLNTGVDLLVFTICCEIFKIDPKFAKVIAQSAAVCNSYIINKSWTFKNNKVYKKSEILKFLIIQLTSLCLAYLGMFIFHDTLGINRYLCQLPIAAVTTTINYLGNKLFVFK